MILTQQQVDGLRQRHDNAGHAHGYPVGVNDLALKDEALDSIFSSMDEEK